jgi:hypothetical protein
VPNLTAASQNLFELIQAQTLIAYPDAGMRLAMSRAVAVETSCGWRIAKDKQSHKIDVVVTLAMAALGVVRGQSESTYDTTMAWVDGPSRDAKTEDERNAEWRRQRFAAYVMSGGLPLCDSRVSARRAWRRVCTAGASFWV